MNKTEQLAHFDRMTAHMRRLIETKGNDYANDDRLANFKNSAAITGVNPEMVCLNLIAVKVSRIVNLLGSQPDNEPIRDSVLDLANYAILLDMILGERSAEYGPAILRKGGEV